MWAVAGTEIESKIKLTPLHDFIKELILELPEGEILDFQSGGFIQIDVPEDILLKRITGRQVCKNCFKIYNKYFDPFPNNGCQICGKKDIITMEILSQYLSIMKMEDLSVLIFIEKMK